MTSAIQLRHLSKSYNGRPALDDATLSVEPGEIFGFLGPNGAGKTTTIRLLLDLIRPTSGSASILGFDCQTESISVRSITGYLPGDLRLYPGMSGAEMISLVSNLQIRPVDQKYITGLAEQLRLDLHHHVGTYSKGTRQKLGVMLALLSRPRVLLLDEPTSGLDPIMQQVVWQILRESASTGTAVFFSSHVLSEVEQVCERVGMIRAGKLVAVEPISVLRGRAVRRIEVTFGAAPETAFEIPGVEEIARRESTIVYQVTSHVDEFIKALAAFQVIDVKSEQPSLEEVLRDYYQGAPI